MRGVTPTAAGVIGSLVFSVFSPAFAAEPELISAVNPAINIPATAALGADRPIVSGNGRYVAFLSSSSDLVLNDTNHGTDAFVYDRQANTVERVSLSSTGAQLDSGANSIPAVSADARYIAFSSDDPDAVSNDTNGASDVFLRDRQSGTTTRVSVSSGAAQANGGSGSPAITSDGRYIAFVSNATNLAAGTPTSGSPSNVFVRDRQTGVTERIDFTTSSRYLGVIAVLSPQLSADGRYVAFIVQGVRSGGPGFPDEHRDAYLFDRQTHATSCLHCPSTSEELSGDSEDLSISANGRFVAFSSSAANLTAQSNGLPQIYVLDRQSGALTLVSRDSGGGTPHRASSDPAISADGRFVAYSSDAPNLVSGDTNEQPDIFVFDRQSNATRRVSISTSSVQSNDVSFWPSISADGRYIAFVSGSTTFSPYDANFRWDAFVRDMTAAITTPVSVTTLKTRTGAADSFTTQPGRVISADNRFVLFGSYAANYAANDTNNTLDLFVRDRQNGTNDRVTVSSSGQGANGYSFYSGMSSDARYVAFSSEATNLVSGDTNQVTDVFLRDRQSQTTKRISISSGGSQANQLSERPSVSNNGRYIAFHSWASNLVAGDTNERADIFVYDRVTAQIERMSVGPGGQQGIHGALNAIISGNGRFVVFHADINNFAPPGTQQGGIGLFVRDRQNGTTTLLNIGPNGGAAVEVGDISVSADGRYIAFVSSVPNLVPGDFNQLPDVFVYDRTLGQTTRISVATDGSEANGESFQPSITENGRYVVFASTASNFVAGEIGGDFATQDVFVHDRLNGTTRRVNPRTVLDEAWYSVYGQPSISDDGGKVVFLTTSKDVIQNDLNDVSDAVMIDRPVSVIRINTGGPGWTDSQGHFWEADRAYNTGSVSSFSNAIGNTSDDTLYQTERWDAETQPELQYHFAVANGTYLVRLHFAENVARNWSVGARVFDVDIEGINRFNDIDVFREAGARNALVKSTTVTVTDGELNILFRHQIQNPIIDAIEVIAQ